MTEPAAGGQDALPGLRATVRAARRRSAPGAEPDAAIDPVARVVVDVSLAHLDRDFDYRVPASMAESARPGARVTVRFAGQVLPGFVLSRHATSDHDGRLSPLRSVVSAEPVLQPEIADLAARIAARYAGTRGDVLRLAIPPRHARTEREESPPAGEASHPAAEESPPAGEESPPAGEASPPAAEESPPAAEESPPDGSAAWSDYPAGPAFVGHLTTGEAPRAVWAATPGSEWPLQIAHAVAATLASGRGSIVCVPDGRDVDRVSAALTTLIGADQHVRLTADLGPAARYRAFLALVRGRVRIAIGTRAAAFAPVRDLGLVVCWDDGDDLHAEPRAPYPHTREVLLVRADAQHTAALIGGFARTVEAHHLVTSGWARPLDAPRELIRQRITVRAPGGGPRDVDRDPHAARVPRAAHELIRAAIDHGPVLVSAPRSGYVPALACERCRTPAHCTVCSGPLQLTGPLAPPRCRWCAHEEPDWRCGTCGARGLRAPVVGETRTAEELGRSFPSITVRSSGGDRVLATVEARPSLVVATPGAEPVCPGGYAAAVILDAWLPLARLDLRAEEEALRRFLAVGGLVRPGGDLFVVGDPAHPVVQALVRWDPVGFAERETAQRAAARLPPASRWATITGEPGPVDDAVTLLRLPAYADVLGPVPEGEGLSRVVVRVPRRDGILLAEALGEVQRVRSARKLDPIRIQIDPPTL